MSDYIDRLTLADWILAAVLVWFVGTALLLAWARALSWLHERRMARLPRRPWDVEDLQHESDETGTDL